MKLCTVGLGYIGLPTSIMFAKYGVDVVGVDVQKSVVDSLNAGQIHIEEPGLQAALEEVAQNKKFVAKLKPETADVFIIAVPTPNHDDAHKSCDLTYVLDATKAVVPYLKKGDVLIIESTIAPRTTDDYVLPIVEEAGFTVGEDIYLVHCPERVLPGQIMHELIYNNRIVGGVTEACTLAGAKVYETFVQGEIIKTDAKTAEMSKLMENTFRDVNIALANELAKVSTNLNIDALAVIEMANKHPRVNLHTPGPGVGGHCLAVDPYFIIAKDPENALLINLSREINSSMPAYVVANVNKLMDKNNGQKIAVFGLTYKGNVDDIRESPAMEIYEQLKQEGRYDVVAYDPHVNKDFVVNDLSEALVNTDLVLVLADHDEFKDLSGESYANLDHKFILDTKNIVKKHRQETTYINYGNMYKYL